MDSQASSTLIGQVFSHLSAHVGCIQLNALFHILFASLHTLAFFQVLLHTSAFFLGVGSEIWLMLFHFRGGSCMLAKHNMLINFVLSQGHTANSVTSILGSLQFEFGGMVYISTSVHVKFTVEHALNHLWQLICSWSLYQTLQFPPTGVNSLSCSKRADHHAGALGSSDTNTTSLVPFSTVVTR